MHRALPDARDGLKPVHRRIALGMRLLGSIPGTPFRSAAEIVGIVGGLVPSAWRPGDPRRHGASGAGFPACRLRWSTARRFGNIDGDNPAAYRYTEARMTEDALALARGYRQDGVEFRPNYDSRNPNRS